MSPGRSLAALLATVAVTGLGGSGSLAYFTDSGSLDSGSLSSTTVGAPTLSCGALGVLSVTLNWTAVANATGYTVHYGSGAGLTLTLGAVTTTVFVSAISGGTVYVVANRAFAGTTWSSVASNSKTYTVAASSTCS